MTYTYALLEVSAATYEEIATKLREAGYGHAFSEGGAMDMHGIALVQEERMPNRLMQFFKYDHLPEHLRAPSQACAGLAATMDETLPEGAEKTAGLRKLLEAKDCFVRAVLEAPAGTEKKTA